MEGEETLTGLTSSASPEGSQSASPLTVVQDNCCAICGNEYKQPRVLGCLHIYCHACLEKQLLHREGSSEELVSLVDRPDDVLICVQCKQETHLTDKSLNDLAMDYCMVNMLDMSGVDEMQIVCTSCKAKEKAVARCSDCANFLCPNCVTAHQYMRCFENHKVVSFEDFQNGEGVAIHKPLFCMVHPAENMKYFCLTCQVTICNECMVAEHKQPGHVYERIADIEDKQKEELQNLIAESKSKIKFCEEASANLEGSLSELQMQRDNAKGQIQETFQSYKAILEKVQDDLLKELEEFHSSQELAIMEMCHNVEQTVEKIQDGCKFTERILKHGNGVEILSMKKLISSQLLSLINNTPKPEVNIKIEFQTDSEKYEEAVKNTFGSFQKEETKDAQTSSGQSSQAVSLQSSFETEGFALPPGVLSPETPPGLHPVTAPEFIPAMPPLAALPPLSLPNLVSLPGSVGVSQHAINSIASSMQNLPPSERSSSRNSYSPAMSDSGISVDAPSSGSGSNTPMINFAALSKLGTLGVNDQGQITLNGQLIPGLNVNNVSGIPHGITSRAIHPPTTPTPSAMPEPGLLSPKVGRAMFSTSFLPQRTEDLLNLQNNGISSDTIAALSNLLSGGSGGSGASTPSIRPQTPMNDLTGLLNQPTSQFNGLAGIGTIGSASGTSSVMTSPASMPINGGLAMGLHQSGNYQPNPHPPFPQRSGKTTAMQIRCKFGQLGPAKGQFNSPHGFCLGMEEDIIVADTNNHRVQVFEKTGEFKYQFGIPGREEGQLWYPRKVAVMRHSGKYVVCDRGNERSRMQIFTKNGQFIKKIAIRYIDIVAGLAITQQGHIVAVDSVSPTVFCIAETGDLLKWFDCSDFMREPSDIAISGKEYFVCDFKGHCVVVFNEEGQFLRRIGCENITNFPNGIDISDAGDVLVGDSHGNRFHVAVFQRDGSLIGEFECPYVKVSRCCGLKITSEGYVVTLAKNNHHVLVLNTLYIT